MMDHKELEVWQKAFELVLDVYKIVEKLPKNEKFVLSDQVRRSAISIPSNIAEGHDRGSTKEFIHFLYISLGSAAELETQLLMINKIYLVNVGNEIESLKSIRMMINKLISSLKRRVK